MKNNKTKPIKKLLIFTIITVMIASLFAVPAFAGYDASMGQWTVDVQKTFEELQNMHPDWYTTSMASQVEGSYIIMNNGSSLASYAMSAGMNADGSYEFLLQPVFIVCNDYFDDVYSGYCSSLKFNMVDSSDDIYNVIAVIGNDSIQINSINICFDSIDINSYLTTYGQDVFELVSDYAPLYYVISQETPTDPDTPTPPADGEEQGIFAVWSKITQWIVQGLASVSNAFYADGKLTLLGTLCIIPLALGLAFLLIGIIQKFLRLRG